METHINNHHLENNALPLGLIKENTLLYYDYFEQCFKIWDMTYENTCVGAKIHGLEEDQDKIVEVVLHPKFKIDQNNLMVVRYQDNSIKLKRVQIVEGGRTSLENL